MDAEVRQGAPDLSPGARAAFQLGVAVKDHHHTNTDAQQEQPGVVISGETAKECHI
jgi:hypothetical protein